jgi:hypothetical protein
MKAITMENNYQALFEEALNTIIKARSIISPRPELHDDFPETIEKSVDKIITSLLHDKDNQHLVKDAIKIEGRFLGVIDVMDEEASHLVKLGTTLGCTGLDIYEKN